MTADTKARLTAGSVLAWFAGAVPWIHADAGRFIGLGQQVEHPWGRILEGAVLYLAATIAGVVGTAVVVILLYCILTLIFGHPAEPTK